MDDDGLLDVLREAARAVQRALGGLDDWGPAGTRAGQYHSDVAADAAALAVLDRAGLGVLSEETGPANTDRDVVVVLDPVDGSTNASRRLPWYAASLCAVDAGGPRAAVVLNLATGTWFDAVRGGGARCDGVTITPTDCRDVGDALVGLSGWPDRHLGWRQFRAFGAAALDLCAVASGQLDGYVDCSPDAHGSWDYLAGALVCQEAGAVVADALGRDLVVVEHAARRTPIAAATPELLDGLIAARATLRP